MALFGGTIHSGIALLDCIMWWHWVTFCPYLGWGSRIKVEANGILKVPSESQAGLFYTVEPARALCSCPVSGVGIFCKHLHITELWAAESGNPAVVAEKFRCLVADEIFEREDFEIIGNLFFVFFAGRRDGIIDVSAKELRCTCVANSFGIECICMKVCRRWKQLSSPGNSAIDSSPVAAEEADLLEEEATVFPEQGASKSPEEEGKLMGGTSDSIPGPSFLDNSYQEMLRDLLQHSEANLLYRPTEDMWKMLKQIHTAVLSPFLTKNRKRRLQPLQPGRRSRPRAPQEHYSGDEDMEPLQKKKVSSFTKTTDLQKKKKSSVRRNPLALIFPSNKGKKKGKKGKNKS